MFFPFSDHVQVNIGSDSSASNEVIYTTPYRAMICLEILSMESNKNQDMYAEIGGDVDRKNYFIQNKMNITANSGVIVSNSFGLTKILPAGTRIRRNGDFSPFSGVFHVFKLP